MLAAIHPQAGNEPPNSSSRSTPTKRSDRQPAFGLRRRDFDPSLALIAIGVFSEPVHADVGLLCEANRSTASQLVTSFECFG